MHNAPIHNVPVIGPVRVEFAEFEGDPVVLPQPQRVHGGQSRLLVDPVVAGVEAVEVGRPNPALLGGGAGAERRQERLANMKVSVLELAYSFRANGPDTKSFGPSILTTAEPLHPLHEIFS